MSVDFRTAAFREHPEYGVVLDTTVEPWDHPLAVNVGAGNIRPLLGLLGLPVNEEPSGEVNADVLLEAIAAAKAKPELALYGLPRTDSHENAPAWVGRARWVDMGRDEGYMADKLDALAALAEHAKASDLLVAWA